MGEYTQETSKPQFKSSYPAVIKVKNFMKQRGITTAKSQKRALKVYGELVSTDRPTYHAVNNWKEFKNFIDNRVPRKKKEV